MGNWFREQRLDQPDYEVPHCPICGRETDTIYEDKDGQVVACGECLVRRDAWEWMEGVKRDREWAIKL